jgi:flagellar basal-body rod modification protein FlgD
MATDAITSASGLGQKAANTAQQRIGLADDFQQFLTLLTTQLQHQDPLSPMDSTEFTNQLVQFSQVEQQINMNQKLDSMVALQLASISSVALGYVGMDISYISSDMNYDGEKPIDISYALASEAVTSKVNIYDESGALVYSQDAPKNVGMNTFTWNGIKTNGEPVSAGTYTVKIDAVDKSNAKIENTTVVSGYVSGIETQDGIVYVLVGNRAVPISSIVNAKDSSAPSSSGASSALAYVGMDVAYSVKEINYNGNGTIDINYNLAETANQSSLRIFDNGGNVVYTTSISQMPGNNTFVWNGTKNDGSAVGSGTYKIEIDSLTSENKKIDTYAFQYGNVEGVESKGGIAYVLIGDRPVPASNILTAKKPLTQTI